MHTVRQGIYTIHIIIMHITNNVIVKNNNKYDIINTI